MKAYILFVESTRTTFKFEDTTATYVDPNDPPYGYGETIHIREGEYHNPFFSRVSGLIGGEMEVNVYPEQFNIPCIIGTVYHFWTGPEEVMKACVAAVKQELYPPDYMI